jgi:hypothetical protein
MTRVKAFSYHFLISILVFSLIFSVFIALWFPQPYFTVTGGWQGLIIAALVDLVLGPLLTFIVYNTYKSKSKLIFDYCVIGLLQISALAFGVHTVYQQRPVVNVFWKGTFSTVNAQRIVEQQVDLDRIHAISSNTPSFAFLMDLDQQKHYKTGENKGKVIPYYYRTDLYQPLQDHVKAMMEYELDIDTILNEHPFVGSALARILEKYDLEKDDLLYYKLLSSHKNMIVIFDDKANYISYITLSKEIDLLNY